MRASSVIVPSTIVVIACCTLVAAQLGRFEAAKRAGINYIESEQYDKAAGRLEEVWEQDQSDAVIGAHLALAYLNTEDRVGLAENQAKANATPFSLGRRPACRRSIGQTWSDSPDNGEKEGKTPHTRPPSLR